MSSPHIAELPNETILDILIWAIEGSKAVDHYTTIVRLMLVCSRWAVLISECRRLWSCFHEGLQPDSIHQMLVRSNNHPLSVDYHYNRKLEPWDGSHDLRRHDAFLEEAVKVMSRWRSAIFRIIENSLLEDLEAHSAPMIETCTLSLYGQRYRLDLFSGDAPRLRHLSLRRVSIPWDSPLLTNLRHLSLSDMDDLEPEELLGALSSCPRLAFLRLTDISWYADPNIQYEIIHLPELRHLIVDDSHLKWLIPGAIRAPQLRLADLEAPLFNIKRARNLLSFVAARLGPCLQAASWFGITFTDELYLYVRKVRCDYPFQLVLRHDSSGNVLRVLQDPRIQAMIAKTPASFSINCPEPVQKEAMSNILRTLDNLPSLETLHFISDINLTEIFDYLSEPVVTDGVATWRCPNLTSINLRNCLRYNPCDLLLLVRRRVDAARDVDQGSGQGVARPKPLAEVTLDQKTTMDDDTWMELKRIIESQKKS